MNRRAYCVVHLDTSVMPPRVIGAGIYSESASSLSGAIRMGSFAFDVADAEGEDYAAAKVNLRHQCTGGVVGRIYGWAIALVDWSES